MKVDNKFEIGSFTRFATGRIFADSYSSVILPQGIAWL
jgi:hypothetical protein